MRSHQKSDLARERLLDKAEILFAQKGYHAVTVREITKAATCNLASVNYHFGNKKNLYLDVFRVRWMPRAKGLQKFFRDSLAAKEVSAPAVIIQALARAFLEGPFSDEERQRHFQLMTREMSQPTEAFEFVANHVMQPFYNELADMFEAFVPDGLPRERLLLKIMSIFSIVLHFNFARTAVAHVTGREYDTSFKVQLIDHIIDFALAGLYGSQKETIA
ncbi:MAG: CerR family C-terminal domain-containing protein [Deltaproteobacteria bacterium]|nr:CerR family C-terminal domain-containing protein [Deltaproteobacteria bacterium]